MHWKGSDWFLIGWYFEDAAFDLQDDHRFNSLSSVHPQKSQSLFLFKFFLSLNLFVMAIWPTGRLSGQTASSWQTVSVSTVYLT